MKASALDSFLETLLSHCLRSNNLHHGKHSTDSRLENSSRLEVRAVSSVGKNLI